MRSQARDRPVGVDIYYRLVDVVGRLQQAIETTKSDFIKFSHAPMAGFRTDISSISVGPAAGAWLDVVAAIVSHSVGKKTRKKNV